MKSIRSILHILLGVTLICSCNEATELAHITPNVSLIKPQIRDFPHEVLQTEEKCAFD